MTSRRDRFLSLRNDVPHVLPSLLQCDFGRLDREVCRLEEAGVTALHLDVMDGHFVPNFTYGMPLVAAFRNLTALPLDVHLMIARPERYLERFHEAGADAMTVHVEAVDDPSAVLKEIGQLGVAAGIALNPATPLSRIAGCLDVCDFALVMSVPAGFGGQAFDDVALDKLQQLRRIANPDMLLEVDGGVSLETIDRCAAAGAQLLVVGSAIFGAEDYTRVVRKLTTMATAART